MILWHLQEWMFCLHEDRVDQNQHGCCPNFQFRMHVVMHRKIQADNLDK